MPPPRNNASDNLDLTQELLFDGAGGDGGPSSFTDGSVPSCTYSGADIKLLVHLPSEEASATRGELETLNSEINDLAEEQSRPTTPAARRNELQLAIQAAVERGVELTEQLERSQAVTRDLAEIQTLSVSTHREKFPVRPLGSTYPKSFCRGPRSIAGSMVFTVFHHHVFQELLESGSYRSTGVGDWDRHQWSTFITDQLPPLDISVRFANEYGNLSWMALLGVEFVNEGMVMSSEDIVIEGTNTFVARDYDLIRNVANRSLTRNFGVGQNLTGSQLLQRNLTARLRGRRYPFI